MSREEGFRAPVWIAAKTLKKYIGFASIPGGALPFF